MVLIYILELENNKYYVGKTTNPTFRLDQHFNNYGSQWTKKYKPIKVLELKPNCDEYDEDKYTKMYMDKFGIDNVRGGSYVQIKLDKTTIENLTKMNRGTFDKCFLCGEKGHFANENKCKKSDKEDYYKNKCTRCGRIGHYSNMCYAKTHIDSSKEEIEEIEAFCCSYCDKEFKKLKGVTCHENLYCKYKNNNSIDNNLHDDSTSESTSDSTSESTNEIEVFCCSYCDKEFKTLKGATYHENVYCKHKNSTSKKNICYRCGRHGHTSNDCYASKHISGKYLK